MFIQARKLTLTVSFKQHSKAGFQLHNFQVKETSEVRKQTVGGPGI